jgi:uncharacterized protein YfiM (DUF2279 family)
MIINIILYHLTVKNLSKFKSVYKSLVLLPYLVLVLFCQSNAQPIATKDSIPKHPNRKLLYVGVLAGAAYGLTLYELDHLWYSQSPKSKFHFFNDNSEWNQMDKMGHLYSSFYLSTYGVDLLKWGGMSQKKAILFDNILGIALLTPIEIMDGYSSAYGASWGDEVADAAGDIFAYGQYILWNKMRIYPKFSYHDTHYSGLRPNVLGSNFAERLIKDYNGQTYWFSTPFRDWTKNKTSKIPKWLGISVGYGATGMVYANPVTNAEHDYHSYRKFYLSLDIFLSKIETKSKFVNTIFYLTNMIRFPLPALEYNNHQGFIFHPIYY